MKKLIFSLIILISTTVSASVIRIPEDQQDIQSGIEIAEAGDTVLIADGTYAGAGNRDIDFSGKSIVVTSENGPGDCIIDCGGSASNPHRGFIFDSRETEDAVLNGVTVRNGASCFDYGGGGIICWNDSSPTITGCILSSNYSDGYGGGISCVASSPVISECVISNNLCDGSGGAISCRGYSFPLLSGCLAEENYAREEAGGVYCDYSSPVLNGNYFKNNRSVSGQEMYCFNLIDERIDARNNDFSGYFLSYYYVSPQECFDLTGCTAETMPLTQNIYVSASGSDENEGTEQSPFLTIRHALSRAYGTISNPIDINVAAGLYSASATGEEFPLPMMRYVSLRGAGAEATVLDGEAGGRLLVCKQDKFFSVSELKISGGLQAWYGGGMYCFDSSPEISGCIISDNDADKGGAFYFIDSQATITDCVFLSNSAYRGGSIFITNSVVEIYDSLFTENGAYHGGVIYCNERSLVKPFHCTFSNNTSEFDGGVFYFDRVSPLIRECSFVDNYSPTGGAVFCINSYAPTFYKCSFSGNSAVRGGAAGCSSNWPMFNECYFTNNTAESGGAIYGYDTDMTAVNCLFTENNAENGGAFYCLNGEPAFNNVTFYQNTAYVSGGAICSDDATQNIDNTILWDNEAPLGSQIAMHWSGDQGNPSRLYIKFCDVQGGQEDIYVEQGTEIDWGEGMISQDPMFVSGPEGDFYLSRIQAGQQYDSPCVDAGFDYAYKNCFAPPQEHICMDVLWTRTDEQFDDGTVDMGYHYGSSYLVTPTPFPTATPTLTPTATDVPSVTPTLPSGTGVNLELSQTVFHPGDPFLLKAQIYNYGPEKYPGIPFAVLLDVHGLLLWHPGWTENFDYQLVILDTGTIALEILNFTWPETSGSETGLTFYGALLTMDFSSVLGDYDSVAFGWE